MIHNVMVSRRVTQFVSMPIESPSADDAQQIALALASRTGYIEINDSVVDLVWMSVDYAVPPTSVQIVSCAAEE